MPGHDASSLTVFEPCDVLVLGAGVAALQAAVAAAGLGAKVRLVAWAKGASPFILGFNAPVNTAGGDSAEAFAADTFDGGYRLGNWDLVHALSEHAVDAYTELKDWGVPFEQGAQGPALRHLSGSALPRSVYVKSGTGNAILKVLNEQADALGVEQHIGLEVLKLIKLEGRVVGALVRNPREGRCMVFTASNTVLATGGIGGIYDDSTYPSDIMGDSYALALDAGASLVDMEFVQFEPTIVTRPDSVKGMEMPTAMLGDGATLKNAALERFMCRYNPDHCEKKIEKARMALCIQSEIDQGRGTPDGTVWFDATSLSEDTLKGYQTHYRRLMNAGVDPAKDLIPIRPASHSLMGGIKINAHCRSEVDGLFVCGEAAGGVHGASRIAGNGASDVIVFGRIAGLAAAGNRRVKIDTVEAVRIAAEALQADSPTPMSSSAATKEFNRLSIATVKRLMTRHVGIKRSRDGLCQALAQLQGIAKDVDASWNGSVCHALAPARNAAMVAMSITGSALRRTESRGAHFRTDYPDIDTARWTRSITIKLDGQGHLCYTD